MAIGMKGHNLNLLSQQLSQLQGFLSKYPLFYSHVDIPVYFCIDSSTYLEYLKLKKIHSEQERKEAIKNLLLPYFHEIQKLEQTQKTRYSWRYKFDDLQTSVEHNRTCSKYIVRSSAVYSEDSDNSGAGVYESIGDITSLEGFIQGVEQVYKSVNSRSAKLYRKQVGVTQTELMGLVVQEQITELDYKNHYSTLHTVSDSGVGSGYVNTKYGENQMKISMNGTSIVLDKKKLDGLVKNHEFPMFESKSEANISLIEDSYLSDELLRKRLLVQDLYHNKVFDRNSQSLYILERVALISYFLEKIWKKDIQIEYGFIGGDHFYLYQVRELHVSSKVHIQSIEINSVKKYISENGYTLVGSGTGLGTVQSQGICINLQSLQSSLERGTLSRSDLKVLKSESEKGRIFSHVGNSNTWSIKNINLEELLKSISVLLVLSPSKDLNNGHLETRCIELGIPYIDQVTWEDGYSYHQLRDILSKDTSMFLYTLPKTNITSIYVKI